MSDMAWDAQGRTGARLRDSETGADLGCATDAQIEASYAANANETGHILIDSDGDVVAGGSWDPLHGGVRVLFDTNESEA